MINSRQQGYSLIEVMLTVVILSIGLAGLGLLQVNNVQNTYNANNRAAAATAASDMADRIRANLLAYENGIFSNISTGSDNGCATGGGGTECNFTQMAQDDFNQWTTNLANILPQGAGIVCVDNAVIDDGEPGAPACTGTGNTVVKVFWRENASFSDDQAGDDIDNQWQAFGLVVYP
jgi:type IV pilus assembly protein PilV